LPIYNQHKIQKHIMRILILFVIISSFISCSKGYQKKNNDTLSAGENLFRKAFQAHGGKKYNQAHYSFLFREKEYLFKNDGAKYSYQVTSYKDGRTRKDILDNNGFTRMENGETLTLSDKKKNSYSNSLNSVIYFATLPHKLQDKAVKKKHLGSKTIKNKDYEVLEITFNQEGGGDDFEDTYYYWINKEDHLIDYLAYNYKVNRGGVRFRTAYNTRKIDGIIFQDYVNYKAEVGTPLSSLPDLWEENKLKELSKIITEQIKSL